jgi:hypothetical protein
LSNWQELGKGGTRGCDDQKNKNYWERLRSNMCNKKKEQRIISNKKIFFTILIFFFFNFKSFARVTLFFEGQENIPKDKKETYKQTKHGQKHLARCIDDIEVKTHIAR